MSKKLLDLDGLRYFHGKILARMGNLSNPNLLINGDIQIWQRGTSFERISGKYTADRWLYDTPGKASGFNGKIEKIANGLKLTQLDGLSMNHKLRYLMEVLESLQGQKLTLTLKYKTNKVFGVSFLGNNLATVADSNVNTLKATGLYSGDFELFSIATYNNTDTSMFLELYSVKVELGEIATPLSPRSYGEELALCQRYYEKGSYSFFPAITSTNITGRGFKVTKRTTPMIFIVSEQGTVNRVSTVSGQDLDKHASAALVNNEGFRQVDILEGITIGESYIYTWLADSEIY